ncbi:MAG: type I pullulanase [Eubacteriales bacterium]|nr:type I pullulanase [Eubacteriales bacterium]
MNHLASLHTPEFNKKYYYDGPLGAFYSPQESQFRLWAPTAVRVQLSLGKGQKLLLDLASSAQHPGLWTLDLQGDFALQDYSYLLTFPDGRVQEAADPYAVATRANGRPAVLLDPSLYYPVGWREERSPSYVPQGDIAIYEIHIRDLTIGPDNGIYHKGKFLGLTEPDTHTSSGQPSGLAYLQSLGVSHIQIMPCFDFATVDEAGNLSFNAQYNWGYDPQNYNVLEGSYSSQPQDPTSRIIEFKSLVQTLHKAGFKVIMDVVYNHVYDLALSPLQQAVPGYYFRLQQDGNPCNGTGCGNETASEQTMFRKYMVDSLTYWASHYQIDGFRFDLMGIHDVPTMQAIRQALDAIDPGIIILGEGWQMGAHPAGQLAADQRQAQELPGIRFFNDQFRDALRGSNFGQGAPGFLSGDTSLEKTWQVYKNIQGQPDHGYYLDASQSVIYSECHDNATLFDKIRQTLGDISREESTKRQALALSIQALSFGTLFFHAGQEFMRTKRGLDNTYNAPDEINMLDYEQAALYPDLGRLFRHLLALRRRLSIFSLTSYEEIQASLETYEIAEGHIAYLLHSEGQTYLIAHNAQTEAWQLNLPAGSWQPCLAQWQLPNNAAEIFPLVQSSISLEPLESVVLQVVAPA